jgi:hypothetical protein
MYFWSKDKMPISCEVFEHMQKSSNVYVRFENLCFQWHYYQMHWLIQTKDKHRTRVLFVTQRIWPLCAHFSCRYTLCLGKRFWKTFGSYCVHADLIKNNGQQGMLTLPRHLIQHHVFLSGTSLCTSFGNSYLI